MNNNTENINNEQVAVTPEAENTAINGKQPSADITASSGEKKSSAKGISRKAIIPLAVIGALLVLLSLVASLFTQVGSSTVLKFGRNFDFSNSGLTDTEDIYSLKNPLSIDLRGNDIPVEKIIELSESYPECDIIWTVPVSGTAIDSCEESINAASFTLEDTAMLEYFNDLKHIDARGTSSDVLNAIMDLGLDCEIDWDITLGGNVYTPDATSVVTGDATDSEIRSLAHLTSLEEVDARGSKAYDALLYLQEQLPDCRIEWIVDIYGMEVSSTEELLDFKRMKIDDISRLDSDFQNLKYLPALTEIDMCGCGVENEQMAKWRDTYTDKKFVWEVTFGNKRKSWTVRTDIEAFSSLLSTGTNDFYLGDQDIYTELFLYCRDLKALDLGHNRITDISMITNLKKLQAIVLMDNKITDFSCLAELPELRFAEINKNKFTDISFVRDCEKLEHLDISMSKVSDLTPLYDCESIKYFIIYDTKFKKEDVRAFEAARPDCVISWHGGYQYQILRCTALRSGYRYVLKNYMYLDTFTDWENFTFVEGARLAEPIGHRPPSYYEAGRYEAAYERFKALGEY